MAQKLDIELALGRLESLRNDIKDWEPSAIWFQIHGDEVGRFGADLEMVIAACRFMLDETEDG